jgi:hypothetical protein
MIYYFQKLVGVVVFAKVQVPEGSADLWKYIETFLTKIQKSEGNSSTLKN